MANKHSVTVNGITFKRTSADRHYTHAVVTVFHGWPKDKTRAVVSWCGSYALAVKQQATHRRTFACIQFSVIVKNGESAHVSESPFATAAEVDALLAGDYDDSPPQSQEADCPACNGTATILGRLGDLDHFRCLACGMESSRPVQS